MKFIVAKQGTKHVRLSMVQYHLHVQYFACAKQFERRPARARAIARVSGQELLRKTIWI